MDIDGNRSYHLSISYITGYTCHAVDYNIVRHVYSRRQFQAKSVNYNDNCNPH